MAQPTAITVGRSLPGFFARLAVLPLFAAVAAWSLAGVGMILFATVVAAIAFSGVCLLIIAVSQRPRVDIEADGFLQRQQLANAGEFDVVQRGRTDFAGIEARSRLHPCGWSQQAADNVGSDGM